MQRLFTPRCPIAGLSSYQGNGTGRWKKHQTSSCRKFSRSWQSQLLAQDETDHGAAPLRNSTACPQPPERIGFDETLADALAPWRQYHDCFYLLWLDSGDFEEWAKMHLSDPSSVVNSRGRNLAWKVSEFRRCYLWWFQDEGADDCVPATKCPRCSGTLDVRFKGERPQGGGLLVCEQCSIVLAVADR
jgi:hypothetical protein